MPKLRNVIAGFAISTAVAGGAVGLSTATTTTAASAATIQSGWGDDWSSGWGNWSSCHRSSCHKKSWHKRSWHRSWGCHRNRCHERSRHHGDINTFIVKARGMSDIDFD
ncbi:hypothetical protein [Planotetraspora sp. GP83]|uniref:hypothetical protein n=1 Tax=Planotetraspora sp. GP83 TaxID=3156264 RepID=UPI0035148761